MSTIIDDAALSEVERIKLESGGLRGALVEELALPTSHFSEEAKQILKFHGSYEQEDRDQRKERKKAGLEPAYSFMVRSKLPGGAMTAEQYIVHDDLADRYGDATLRVTTRQGFQFYGILKGNLRNTIRDLNEALVTTFGACGDVARNVITCPAPIAGTARAATIDVAYKLAYALLPTSSSYHDIWVEGSQVTKAAAEPDALYRDRYLPRKFKVAFAFPDDNCTDVFSNDLGLVVIADGGKVIGYNAYVGGGLGTTHGKSETFPRLASPLGFVKPEEVLEVAKAVIAVQRDHGNRVNRKRARMKYLLDERGEVWFREQVEGELGRKLEDVRAVEVSGIQDHLGWHKQGDGRWFRGIWIENGRIHDRGELRLRSALRTIVERFRPSVHLTPQQNLLLTNVLPEQQQAIDTILVEHGVIEPAKLSMVKRHAMACPAIPTCPLAVAEAERVMPGIITRLESELEAMGLGGEELTVRMTGCPNGCARPYTADLAFVGRSLGKYVVYVGGNFEGTRLATHYADLVPMDELVPLVLPLFAQYRDERLPGERFGDYWHRVGVEPRLAAGSRA